MIHRFIKAPTRDNINFVKYKSPRKRKYDNSQICIENNNPLQEEDYRLSLPLKDNNIFCNINVIYNNINVIIYNNFHK